MPARPSPKTAVRFLKMAAKETGDRRFVGALEAMLSYGYAEPAPIATPNGPQDARDVAEQAAFLKGYYAIPSLEDALALSLLTAGGAHNPRRADAPSGDAATELKKILAAYRQLPEDKRQSLEHKGRAEGEQARQKALSRRAQGA